MGFWGWVTSHISGQDRADRAGVALLDDAEGLARPAVGVAPPEQPDLADAERWWAPMAGLQELPQPQRPELSTEARALENLLIMHFDGRNLSLPALPHVPERVLRLLADPDCGLAKVAAEIGKDPVTAAAAIRISNSPLYAGLEKTTSIESAVVRLGGNVIRTLMYNLSLRSVMFSERRHDSQLAEMLWTRALAGGVVMRSLSRFTKLNPEEAFLIGLLHDVGNIVVLRIVNSQGAVIKHSIGFDTFDYLCHEAHQEFGELLADAWSLPARLKSLICDHHAPVAAADPYRTERAQLRLTDMICSLLNYTNYEPVSLLESNAARQLGLAESPDLLRFLVELPARLEEALAELQ